MKKMSVKFIEGAVKNGIEKHLIEKFWEDLLGFADYCFNKSHSACYGMISYQTAYLKAHFPSAFMAALMSSDYDDIDRLAIEITECKHMGIEVLPPDINESFVEFAVVPKTDQIRFGMSAIKNVGTGAVEEVLRVREAEGPFDSLEEFFSCVNTRVVNRKTLESLIKSGAFDRYGERSYLLHNMDVLLAYSQRLQKEKASGQTDLFGNVIEGGPDVRVALRLDKPAVVFKQHEQLVWERELLGLYLSQHPLESFETFLNEHTVPINSLKAEHDNKSVTIGGAVQEFREITTKNGQKMAFVKIGDQFDESELIIFPSMYQQTLGIWERDKIVLVKGKINARDRQGNETGEVKIMVDDAREITPEQAAAYQPTGRKPKQPKETKSKSKKTKAAKTEKPSAAADPRVFIRIEKSDDHDTLLNLRETIDQNKGNTEVVLVVGPDATKQIIRLPMRMDLTDASKAKLAELVGAKNLKLH